MADEARALENATIFSEDLISHVLCQRGIEWYPQRDRIRQLRHAAIYTYTPPIARGVIFMAGRFPDVVIPESLFIWHPMENNPFITRAGILYSSLIILASRIMIIGNEDINFFLFMAIAANLCTRCANAGQQVLIPYAINAMAFALTNIMPGEFVGILYRLRMLSDQLRAIVDPAEAA